jgi:hypothetical protein
MITDVIEVDQVPEMFQALRRPGSRAKVLVEFPDLLSRRAAAAR